ncbi:uncharacterized protein [Gossypium hirsutum]|uniref:Uncharacterized protein LOC107945487 n=1 Tax=Gossypium hirsutum TaxID=3635 RepID=A0A1U8N7B9_GOSHI|nr:uncharacterized protein LOC107945487 [Gossypium hirsutum]XP_016734999.1 uncharacterized protein LOC107945487 [Gossypium hirsutum]XP_016735000.1 uncharacterized protein LOC107945487 [Gossypium hirsutum]XP_016735001.1 uncharacterized protein LOC107945487 [Gossypium hirsutum]XP_016735002.1 uncharacterized protein LOC107945487 [Gossypium hirsutum]
MVVTSFLRSSWRPYFLINCSLKMNLRLLKMILDPQNIHRLKDSRFPLNILDKIVSDITESKQLLDKLVVVKYNGALGKNMGFGGPEWRLENTIKGKASDMVIPSQAVAS